MEQILDARYAAEPIGQLPGDVSLNRANLENQQTLEDGRVTCHLIADEQAAKLGAVSGS